MTKSHSTEIVILLLFQYGHIDVVKTLLNFGSSVLENNEVILLSVLIPDSVCPMKIWPLWRSTNIKELIGIGLFVKVTIYLSSKQGRFV